MYSQFIQAYISVIKKLINDDKNNQCIYGAYIHSYIYSFSYMLL